MGKPGARHSGVTAKAAEALLADLAPLGHVSAKKMFGGYGVFSDGVMFALVDPEGTAFLRICKGNEARFERAERHGRMPYVAIPDDVRADRAALLESAGLSLAAARAAKR